MLQQRPLICKKTDVLITDAAIGRFVTYGPEFVIPYISKTRLNGVTVTVDPDNNAMLVAVEAVPKM